MKDIPSNIIYLKQNCQILADIYVSVTGVELTFNNDILNVVGKPSSYEPSLHTKDKFIDTYSNVPFEIPDDILRILLEAFHLAGV